MKFGHSEALPLPYIRMGQMNYLSHFSGSLRICTARNALVKRPELTKINVKKSAKYDNGIGIIIYLFGLCKHVQNIFT